MARCQVKRGFFVLRDCGNGAVAVCSLCNRAVCSEHITPGIAQITCVDCHARQQQTDDPDDIYTYRHRYYTETHYAPIYSGGTYETYYDDYDVRSFDPPTDDDTLDDGPDEGFHDS